MSINDLDAIGTRKKSFLDNYTLDSSTTSPSTITSITDVPAGIYVVHGHIRFKTASGTGTRLVNISAIGGAVVSNEETEVGGNPSGYTAINSVAIIASSSTFTITLLGRQNSGSSILITAGLYAVRIK